MVEHRAVDSWDNVREWERECVWVWSVEWGGLQSLRDHGKTVREGPGESRVKGVFGLGGSLAMSKESESPCGGHVWWNGGTEVEHTHTCCTWRCCLVLLDKVMIWVPVFFFCLPLCLQDYLKTSDQICHEMLCVGGAWPQEELFLELIGFRSRKLKFPWHGTSNAFFLTFFTFLYKLNTGHGRNSELNRPDASFCMSRPSTNVLELLVLPCLPWTVFHEIAEFLQVLHICFLEL